jgi:hypothetical protein
VSKENGNRRLLTAPIEHDLGLFILDALAAQTVKEGE